MTKVKDLETQIEAIMKKLSDYKEKGGFTSEQITEIQEQLHAIDEKVWIKVIKLTHQWNDGAVHEDDGTIAAGQAEFSDYINDAHEMIADLLETLPEDDE